MKNLLILILSAATASAQVSAWKYNPNTNAQVEPGASTARDMIGLEIGSDVQAYDAALASIAGQTYTAGDMLYATGADTFALIASTSFGRALLNLEDGDALLGQLPADIQNLNVASTTGGRALLNVAGTADTFPYYSASNTVSLASITTAGRNILDDADAAAQRTTMGAAASGAIGSSGLTVSTNSRVLGRTSSGSGAVEQIQVTSPLQATGLALYILDAQANGSTKGAAAFNASSFNDDGNGLIDIDYANGQSATDSVKGFTQLATQAAVEAGVSTSLAVTPDSLYAADLTLGNITAGEGSFSESITGNGTNNRLPNQVADEGSDVMTRDLVDARAVFTVPVVLQNTNSAQSTGSGGWTLSPYAYNSSSTAQPIAIPKEFTKFRIRICFGFSSNPTADSFPIYVRFRRAIAASSTTNESDTGTQFGGVGLYPNDTSGLSGTLVDAAATYGMIANSFIWTSNLITLPAGWQTNAGTFGFYGFAAIYVGNNSGGSLTDNYNNNHAMYGQIEFYR